MLNKTLIASTALVVLSLTSTPSFALIGIEAVQQCVMNAPKGCDIASDPGGNIIINTANGMISCASLQAECTVMKGAADNPKPRKEYQVPESLTSSSGGSDTGVPGTGAGSGPVVWQAVPFNPGGGGQIQ
jgi:hypothetical protein